MGRARGWCERGDSNPHGFPRQILSLVRLPIPPLSRSVVRKIIQAAVTRILRGNQSSLVSGPFWRLGDNVWEFG
jgi:hypothetical protein